MTELTILLPCLNEERSVSFCVGEAMAFLKESGTQGEVLLADNGSTDRSCILGEQLGARVIRVSQQGYGSVLRAGIREARGKYVIMADCDGSYDLFHLQPYLEELRQGADLAVGNRYALGFQPGASPWVHRRIGIPLLSAFGRLIQRRWRPPDGALVYDFHCGLRGVNREAFLRLNCESRGMEFASEMILAATAAGQTIAQLPTGLRPDLRGGERSHIRAFRDGMRHVKLIARWSIK